MITKITITVLGRLLDFNRTAPEGEETPRIYQLRLEIDTDDEDQTSPVSQKETMQILTTALSTVMDA